MTTDYLITITKLVGNDAEEVFSESCDIDSLETTMQSAYRAALDDIGTVILGAHVRVGDVLVGSGRAVTKVLEATTTTSGRTFILVELADRFITALAADSSYQVVRMDRRNA